MYQKYLELRGNLYDEKGELRDNANHLLDQYASSLNTDIESKKESLAALFFLAHKLESEKKECKSLNAVKERIRQQYNNQNELKKLCDLILQSMIVFPHLRLQANDDNYYHLRAVEAVNTKAIELKQCINERILPTELPAAISTKNPDKLFTILIASELTRDRLNNYRSQDIKNEYVKFGQHLGQMTNERNMMQLSKQMLALTTVLAALALTGVVVLIVVSMPTGGVLGIAGALLGVSLAGQVASSMHKYFHKKSQHMSLKTYENQLEKTIDSQSKTLPEQSETPSSGMTPR